MPMRRYKNSLLLLPVVLVSVVAGYYLIVGTGQTVTIASNPPSTPQNVDPSIVEPSRIQPELAKLKLCPFDSKVLIISSSHSYKNINPQRFAINAKRGDNISVTLKVELNPNLLKCIRDTLKLAPGEQLSIKYGLRLGSGEGVTLAGAKKMNLSNVGLQGRGEGPYSLTITIDDDTQPGNYYIVLYAWIEITGKAEIKSETEYTVLLSIG